MAAVTIMTIMYTKKWKWKLLDDDTEMECGILGVFAVDGIADKEYIALLPLEDETVLLYEYKENEDGIELLNIESDDDFEKVSNTFYDLFDDEDE